ncbi:serine/threonine-protein kinase [Microbacterium sp. MEJ108Y]|uniref:serine/threonine-protein kinase n=1 Tax=Microbacterium sp. MEJ108Y TaxID=1587523 RepID=UPI000696BB4E|nr:serine/threonine-protein kinase [Microbacterium sp. MEJ108Y]
MTTWGWDSGKPLGSGTFGKVYAAYGPDSDQLAAKVVPKAKGTTREQLIAQDAPSSPHVVPILQIEETTDSFILYMPRAEYSLRQKMNAGVGAGEAIAILTDLAEALNVIAPFVVHRDIKPENVLFLDGSWALCDFGIARYAEAVTAGDTSKFSFTPEYAAPEQWRYEHATAATDVYAFGVIAHELLAGQRPFNGQLDALRAQHLNVVPDLLPGGRKLAWIVGECLSKAPGARPAAGNLIDRLQRAGVEAATRGGSALAAAQSAVLQAAATEQAAAEAARTERERREALAQSCRSGYAALIEELVEFIADSAPSTAVSRSRDGGVTLTLGDARLVITGVSDFSGSESSPFDVIAYGHIRLDDIRRTRSRSHSFYFADFEAERSYSWYELGFMQGFGPDFENEPRAAQPGEGLGALDGVFGGLGLAYGVIPLDIGDLDRFVDFWAERFGQAASGHFPRLSQLPDGATNRPRRRR